MSIIVVCQIAGSYLLFSLVYSYPCIHLFLSWLYVEKGGEPIFLSETEEVIIKTGYIH